MIDSLFPGSVPMSRVDDGVTRILTPMFQMGLFDDVWKNNKGNLQVNATSVEHNALARKIAAEGLVLLKNVGGAALAGLWIPGHGAAAHSRSRRPPESWAVLRGVPLRRLPAVGRG